MYPIQRAARYLTLSETSPQQAGRSNLPKTPDFAGSSGSPAAELGKPEPDPPRRRDAGEDYSGASRLALVSGKSAC
jgi:hypothetical protein